jgi:hypothetical protein
MADPVCLECARPILPGDAKSTVQQVDACTLAVEHLPYHSACWEKRMTGARSEETGVG